MIFTPADVYHRGYRIVWDVRPVPGTPSWTGKAAVVLPTQTAASDRVHPTGEWGGFNSEEEARDQLISKAKNWIDRRDSQS